MLLRHAEARDRGLRCATRHAVAHDRCVAGGTFHLRTVRNCIQLHRCNCGQNPLRIRALFGTNSCPKLPRGKSLAVWPARRMDEVAGPAPTEVVNIHPSRIYTRSKAQGERTSHGAYCYRFGWKEIPDLRSGQQRDNSRGAELFHGATQPVLGEPTRQSSGAGDMLRGLRHRRPGKAAGARGKGGAGDHGESLGSGSRRVKTDKKDARVLSEVSCRIDIPSVHIPSARARDWKTLCSARDCLVASRTKLINHVRGWLRTQLAEVRSGGVQTFPERVEEKLLSRPEGMPVYIDRELTVIKTLNEQIVAADKELEEIAARETRCRNVMTVPGVGPVTALRFVATIDDVSRFPGAHALQSYLGLTPGENSSSTRERKTSSTKAGAPAMRWLLVQAAWCAWRTRPDDPMVRWAKQVAQRRGNQIGIIALSRKLAGILYAILRDGTRYESKRGSQVVALPADSTT